MSTDDRHAHSLGRWLDQPPGTTPPEDVDSDAVEAVYAIRPDLAPRARVSADDILALVTKGPLAGSAGAATPSGSERSGEVVMFPVRRSAVSESEAEESTPAPAPVRRGRFLVFAAGGTGGIGLALVAAATLLLVAVPALQEQAGPTASPPAAFSTGVSVAPRSPSASEVAPVPPPSAVAQAPARPASAPAPMPSAVSRAPSPEPVAAAEAAREMASAKLAADQRGGIPELAEQQVQSKTTSSVEDAVATADADEPALQEELAAAPAAAAPAGTAAGAYDLTADPSAVRDRAVPTDRDPSSWRVGVDSDTLADIDQAIEKANALRQRGDRRGAGDKLAGAVQPPAQAGQYVAALAALDYLAAGEPKAAAGVAQRGLSLSSENTPERSWLLVLHGDALRAQDKQGAALDAYEQASELNVDR